MGYESKLYIVEKTRHPCVVDGKQYCSVIAMFDVCKFYNLSDKLRNYPETDCCFYADDGDTQMLEDRYGEPLTEIPIADVIAILEDELEKGETYRRIYPVLATLKSLEEHKNQWYELVVLHYGY